MIDQETRSKIYTAFMAGSLKVESVNPSTGTVSYSPVTQVVKHHTSDKIMLRVATSTRSIGVTEDHSLFRYENALPVEVSTKDLVVGDTIAVVHEGSLMGEILTTISEEPMSEFSYDLSVPGDQNFVMTNGILAHNSYSISGVSLDLDKSSKYMSMKENFEQEFDKLKEQAKQSIKIVKGLKQPRYGIGISSALGPFNRTGVQSRRNYVDSGGGYWT